MALLDVTIDGLFDPMLCDLFIVRRRIEIVGDTGRSKTMDKLFKNIAGVVTMASGKDLERLPEGQVFDRVINVVTAFKLQGMVVGKQPDLVIWRGDSYVVKAIDLYPQFGAGFIQAICTSIDIVDNPT